MTHQNLPTFKINIKVKIHVIFGVFQDSRPDTLSDLFPIIIPMQVFTTIPRIDVLLMLHPTLLTFRLQKHKKMT